MKVKNLHGNPGCPCCKSCLDHWENYTQEKAHTCAELGCSNKATLGGHVIKVGSEDRAHYIIPICDSTNHKDEPYDLNFGTKLVPATKQISCHT